MLFEKYFSISFFRKIMLSTGKRGQFHQVRSTFLCLTVFRKICFEKYFSKNSFRKNICRTIFFETYFEKNIVRKILFEKYVSKNIFSKSIFRKNIFRKIFFETYFSKSNCIYWEGRLVPSSAINIPLLGTEDHLKMSEASTLVDMD